MLVLSNIPDRIRSKIQIGAEDDCWLWTGGYHKDGYGSLRYDHKFFLAHRFVYGHIRGIELSSTQVVRHTCDNPPCCNPNHLILGTQRENVHDMIERKRNETGEQKSCAKMKRDFLPVVFSLRASGHSHQAIADKFGVDKSIITRTLGGKAWVRDTKELGLIYA